MRGSWGRVGPVSYGRTGCSRASPASGDGLCRSAVPQGSCRIGPVVRGLTNQRDDLLAFAAQLDQDLAVLATQFQLPVATLREMFNNETLEGWLTLSVDVPADTSATLIVPTGDPSSVTPRTGETVMVPQRCVVIFKPGKALEERVEAAFLHQSPVSWRKQTWYARLSHPSCAAAANRCLLGGFLRSERPEGVACGTPTFTSLAVDLPLPL